MDPEDPMKIFADMKLNSDDFFQILETHRKSCLREGRHDEAELTRLRIIELRVHEERSKKDYLKKKHKADRESLEEAHKVELEQHQNNWESEMAAFNEQRQKVTAELKLKHTQNLADLKDKQRVEEERALNHVPVEILNLRKKVDSLAAAGEYLKSKKIQEKLAQAEEMWKISTLRKCEERWKEQIEKIKKKHSKDAKMNHDKWEKKYKMKITQWKNEVDLLKKRYTNYKNDLENSHNIEKQKLLKEFNVKKRAMDSVSNKPKTRS